MVHSKKNIYSKKKKHNKTKTKKKHNPNQNNPNQEAKAGSCFSLFTLLKRYSNPIAALRHSLRFWNASYENYTSHHPPL